MKEVAVGKVRKKRKEHLMPCHQHINEHSHNFLIVLNLAPLIQIHECINYELWKCKLLTNPFLKSIHDLLFLSLWKTKDAWWPVKWGQIPIPKFHHKAWPMQNQSASCIITWDNKDHAYVLIPPVFVGTCGCIEVDNNASIWIYQRILVCWKNFCPLLKDLIIFR